MRKKKFRILGGVVLMPWEMLNSKAYKALKPSSAKALPFFMGKVKFGRKSGFEYESPVYYETIFRYPFHEGKEQGFSPATFQSVIEDLIDKGFVDPVCRGGKKSAGLGFSKFRLSPRWKMFNTEDFKFVSWEEFKRKRRPSIRSMEEAAVFLQPSDIKYFVDSKTEIEQIQKLKRKSRKSIVISEIEAVGGSKA